jgi:pimeloyl-ACP methyl ester carboxylesterase
MPRIKSDDAELFYRILGSGPPLVLLHPFPVHHEFWMPVSQALVSNYRLILPDLRGHGESEIGRGPATMAKHAADLARILDHAEVGRAALAAVSLGGYIVFEFWRRFRGRVAALALLNTKAQADSADARAARLKTADTVLESGTEPFFESMLPKLLGRTTGTARPDLVDGALRMMRKMSPEGLAMVQRGMAERPDSGATLGTIDVAALIVTGAEDTLTGAPEAEFLCQNISGSQMKVVEKAGHYSAWEQPEQVGPLLRKFFDAVRDAAAWAS